MRRLRVWWLCTRLAVLVAWFWALRIEEEQKAWDRKWWRALREGWVWVDGVGWYRAASGGK